MINRKQTQSGIRDFGAALQRHKMREVQFYEHKDANAVPLLCNFKTITDKKSFPGPSWG